MAKLTEQECKAISKVIKQVNELPATVKASIILLTDEYKQFQNAMRKINNASTKCPYADDYVNVEGWLIQDNDELVCLDWDDYCTLCRKDNSKDYRIEVKC